MKFPLGWLTEHLWLKVISLLLAVGFWFYVVGEESIEITKTVPLKINPPTEKLSVVKNSTSFLEVTFQCPRNLFSVLSSTNVAAVHKLDAAQKAGDYSFNVQSNDFSLPSAEIRILRISPSYVTATLDEVIVKKLPVNVELTGEPAYGYRVDEEAIELDPNAVLVEGSRAVLEKMDVIKTEPVQLVGRVRSFRRTVRIHQAPDLRIVGEGMTDIQIPIKAEYAEKELKDVPVKPLGNPAADYYARLQDDSISVVLKGPRALLDNLLMSQVLAYADIDGLKEGVHQVSVKFILPADVLLKNDPPAISVEVRRLKL